MSTTPSSELLGLTRAVAAAIAADAAIVAYCVAHWGQALRVCLDGLGSWEDAEGAEVAADPPTPYAIVIPSDDSEHGGGGERDEDSFSVAVRLVVDASQKPQGWEDGSKPQQGSDDVWELGGSAAFHGLVRLVRVRAGRDGHGALYRGCRAAYDGFNAYPVQFADQYFDFYAVRTF